MMTLDSENSIFFGQPLIDAYLLQEEIHFYGVLIHATVEQEMVNKNHELPPFIENYLCNLKAGSANHLTIYPMHARSSGKTKYKEAGDELLIAIKKLRLKTSGQLRKYIDNTELYLTLIRKLK